MGSLDRRPHALVIPLPFQGHWNPMKIFIRQLVNLHISVTVLATPDQISELQQLKDEGKFERLHCVKAFGDPPKKRLVITAGKVELMEEEFWMQPALKENLVAQQSAGSGPTFLVADMFLYWTQDIADQLGIPRYTFFTSPTTFSLLVLHAPDLIPYDPSVTQKGDAEVKLAGMETFRASDICKAVFVFREMYSKHSKYLPKAAGILINSWESYEGAEVASLRTCLQKVVGDAKVPSIYLIGPLQCLPVQHLVQNRRQATAETDDSGCLRFLDTQPASSVLYICFGSVAELDQTSVTELAQALELCEEPFLWILPRPNRTLNSTSYHVSEILPQGFQSRTQGRGLLCPDWAPQQEILAHSAVGGFISHCGWNSVVETILSGVAVIPWPYWAEQFMNARFLVEVAKVGVRIQPSADGTFEAKEIAKAMRTLMNSDKGKEKKLRIQELKKTVEIAVGEGGSSLQALQAFHAEVSSLRG